MPYIVMTASIPQAREGSRYRRVAVVETSLPPGKEPSSISPKAAGMVRIVEVWEHLYVGKTRNNAYRRALREAEELCNRLKAENAVALARARRRQTRGMVRVRVKPGTMVKGVRYHNAALMDVTEEWAAQMIEQGLAEAVQP